MVTIVENTDVKQVHSDSALVIAVSHGAVFGVEDDEIYGAGVSFPLLQAVQTVNQRLLEGNPSESVLFDVMLITTNRDQQQRDRVCSSTRHYGLHIHRFCFSCEDDFTESLIQNKVHLFLTTDKDEASQATNRGVFSALLDHHTASCRSEQLRVMFCGDTILDSNSSGIQQASQDFWAKLGQMRQKFGLLDSPLNIVLLTAHGDRNGCVSALRSLRTKGVNVDEAYCLGGAPRGPMMSVLRPHFLLSTP